MAHIKCRYKKEYCGSTQRFNEYRKPCDPEKGDTDICSCAECEYDSWNNIVCEYAYYEPAEFEKTVKNYEIGLGEIDPVLHIGRQYIDHITYLEIDGRVLIGGDENA